ncbi:MAG: carbohydrate kinase [Candidatus Sumerlaeia bacterium]|nr:carbohydrate kinase [Candidatus Sumerlaeia bacterium]
MRKTILAYGEVLWDLLPTGPKLGGAPFNFAYRVHSLGDRGLIASRVGSDDLGRRARERMAALGMDLAYLQTDGQKPTGTVHITLENKKPDYFIVPDVAYDTIAPTPELLALAPACDCICYGTLAQRSPIARATLEKLLDCAGRPPVKLLDINLRKDCFTRETVTASLERADILRLNDDEARFLSEFLGLGTSRLPDFCETMMRRYTLQLCLVTLGESGAFVARANGEAVYTPGYRVEVVDPCGCGDAFTAGFIHRWLRGDPLPRCCELGNALGAMVAMQPGATEPITDEAIQQFLAADRPRTAAAELASFIPT